MENRSQLWKTAVVITFAAEGTIPYMGVYKGNGSYIDYEPNGRFPSQIGRLFLYTQSSPGPLFGAFLI